MMDYLKVPWSIDDTIENLIELRGILENIVINQNLHGRGEQDTKEIEYDFGRAINALRENQEYRKLGTLEEIKLLKATHLTGVELAQISCVIKQLAEYKKLGTLEEVREAVEKQKGKEPYVEEVYCDVIDYQGNICRKVADVYKCHECDSILGYVNDEQYIQYCPKCGQKILWEE